MGYFIVENGGMPVSGEVCISGAKNAALPELAAAVMCGRTVLRGCPHLTDTFDAVEILKTLGFKACLENNTASAEQGGSGYEIPECLCQKMRSSVLFLAPLLIGRGRAEICMPGGCCLGARPVDMHLDVLKQMGAEITSDSKRIYAKAENGLDGCDIFLPFPSVGATETAVMAAAAARGKTRIFNPASEPEIDDLCRFLNSAGADIKFGSVIEINGRGGMLSTAEHSVMPDRIEAGTYLAAAAATGGELFLKNAVGAHLDAVCDVLRGMGCVIKCGEKNIYIDAPAGLDSPPYLETGPYPLFPTDMQPQFTVLFSVKRGECIVNETIFEGRQGHIPQLRKMGADIVIADEHTFLVRGRAGGLEAAETSATDLRCGAALLLAALTAKDGSCVIKNGGYILRGYEDICGKMSLIGVKMRYMP